jgi:hypothetical protein
MAFLMDMLELHWGNTSAGIQIGGNPTDICLQWSEGNRWIHATSTHWLQQTQCTEWRGMSILIHPLPLVRLHMTSASFGMQSGTNCMKSRCIIFIYRLHTGSIIFTSSSVGGFYTKLWINLPFYTVHWWWNIHRGWNT